MEDIHVCKAVLRAMKNERMNIIISSATDARKKTAIISISRRLLVLAVCAVVTLVLVFAGLAVYSAASAAAAANELEALQQAAE